MKKKYLSPKLVEYMESQPLFHREFEKLEAFINRVESVLALYEPVAKPEESTNSISTTSKFASTPRKYVPQFPTDERKLDFLYESHLPYYREYFNRELGKEFTDYNMDFFLEYCFHRMKNGIGFVNRLGQYGGRRKGAPKLYTTVFISIGDLKSEGSRDLLQDMNVNEFELKFKLIQKLNNEINRIVEERSNLY